MDVQGQNIVENVIVDRQLGFSLSLTLRFSDCKQKKQVVHVFKVPTSNGTSGS